MKIHVLIFSILIFGSQMSRATASSPHVELLKKDLSQFDLQNPAGDAQRNLSLCKTRFIGLYGFTVDYPGVSASDFHFVKKYGSDVIKGTSDAVENPEHGELMAKANKYAEVYNKTLLQIYKDQGKRGENTCPTHNTMPSLDQIKNAADQEAIRLGYDIKEMGVQLDPENSQWKKYTSSVPHPDFEASLKGKEFIAVYYSPKNSPNTAILGGDLWIFMDRKSARVIMVLRGK